MTTKADFASQKFDFLHRVAKDAELPNVAARIAVLFATVYMRSENDCAAWPSKATICRELGLRSESTVRAALSQMVERGHLKSEDRSGGTTVYRMADPAEKLRGDPAEKTTGVQKIDPLKNSAGTPVENSAPTPPKNPAPKSGNRKPDKKTGYESLSEPELSFGDEQPREKAIKPEKPATNAANDAAFISFWQQFPKKVDKAEARKVWDTAIKAGDDPLEITQGAMRYAAQRERDEPDPVKRHQFTRGPARWLRQRSWEDAPAPAPTPNANSGGQQTNHSEQRPRWRQPSAFELVMAKQMRRDNEQ